MPGSRPGATAVLVVAAAIVASYFAVAFDRQDNRPPVYVPPTTAPEAPTPTITTDEFVAQIAARVADELDLPPEDEGRIVEVLTDEDQPGVIVVTPTTQPPPRTTTTTSPPTTTSRPLGVSVPSVGDFLDAWDRQSPTTVP